MTARILLHLIRLKNRVVLEVPTHLTIGLTTNYGKDIDLGEMV